ncbi:murein hydrolase activator EnvC family protein [Calothrix sp. 336/3]|uniref:murein hydrolase activator EnvC family protein n=1 Tax=Calothrix sp. 336/3 TaxID=1337936 RepID=UPI0004E31D88|nr:peptidoglycan DD-metalloendopeptidase family protein [Calothrix sp. 336/3]AKG24481.1 peptidase M23 [Calothrix sp. 336/3]
MRTLIVEKKQIFRWLQLAFCCLVSLCLILTVNLSQTIAQVGTSLKTLKQQQQQIETQRQGVMQERDRLTNLQQAAQERLQGLEKNLQTTDNHIQDSEQRLQRATQDLEKLQGNLAQAEASYQAHQQATIARLRFLQRSSVSQGWAVLLQSQSISDFLSRRHSLKLIYQADQEILTKLTTQAKRIQAQKSAVAQQKNEIALIRQQLLSQKADFQAQASSQQELIQRLNSDRLALEAAQNQLDRESQAITTLIQQKVTAEQARNKTNSRTNILIRGTGMFAYPSDAPTSSPFGWRVHPILGYRRMHTGMDFAASHGSTIRAAGSGTVIFAGWHGGYGKTVIISHGDNLSTLYGHSSEIYVSEGQSVQKGQPVAAVGSTGLSTGPHLHFEVRLHGTPVNPADYL